jgi:hypothetical protein
VLLATTILCAALFFAAHSPAQASSTLAQLRHARHDLRVTQNHLRQYRALLRALLAAQAAADSGAGTAMGTEVIASPPPEVSSSPIPDPSASPVPDPSASPVPDPSASPVPDPSPTAMPSPEATMIVDPPTPDVAIAAVSPRPLTAEQLRVRIAHAKARVFRLNRRVNRLRHRLYIERSTARGYYWPLIVDVARDTGVSAPGLQRLMTLESGGRCTAVGGGGAYSGLFQYSLYTWRAAWNPWRMRSIFDPAAQIRATARALRLGYGPSMWPYTYWLSF